MTTRPPERTPGSIAARLEALRARIPPGVTLDKAVIARDQNQKVFSQTFEEFSGRMVPPRMTRGSNMLKQYGSVLGRIEQTYGVPGEIIVAIWGLETDYGVNLGKFATLRSLASLAYDCRRSDLFKAERITIYITDKNRNALISRVKSGEEIQQIVIPITPASIAGYCAVSGQIVWRGAVLHALEGRVGSAIEHRAFALLT